MAIQSLLYTMKDTWNKYKIGVLNLENESTAEIDTYKEGFIFILKLYLLGSNFLFKGNIAVAAPCTVPPPP